MPNRIFIRPNVGWSRDQARFDWALYDSSGTKASQGLSDELESLEQILMQNGLENVRTVLVWPSRNTFATTVNIPGKSQRFVNQALAFAVEEQLAQDISLMHFAIGQRDKKGDYDVACIEKSTFLSVYDYVLGAEDLDLRESHVDAMLLPLQDNDIVISLDASGALIRSAKGEMLGTDAGNLIAYLDSVFLLPEEDVGSANKSVKLFVHGDSKNEHQLLIAELQQYPSIELDVEEVSISQLELLAESFLHSGGSDIDLCQGDFKLQSNDSGAIKRWALVASVAAIAFFIQIGVFVGKGMFYQTQAEEVSLQAVTEYKRLVPNSRDMSPTRLARIIKGQLRQSENQGEDLGFMALLGEAGYQYSRSSGKSGIDFVSINYSQDRGELTIELRAKNFEQLDQLKTALITGGLDAKISSAVQEQGYFRGRLSVGAG